jgi:ferric-dicitrate binding protein FerR (iron transport regulator)
VDCEQAVALISSRIDHEIQTADAAPLDAHLAECPSCRATAEAFSLQHEELNEAFAPRRAAAAAVAEQVNAQLPAARAPAPRRPGARRWARAAAVLGAVAAVAAAALLVQWRWQPPAPPPVNPPTDGPNSPPAHPDTLVARPRPEAPPTAKLAVGESVETRAGERRRFSLPDGSVLYLDEKTAVRLDSDRHATVAVGRVFVEVAPRSPSADGATFVVKTQSDEVKALGTKFEVHTDKDGTGVVVTQGRIKSTAAGDQPVVAGQQLWAPVDRKGSPSPTPAPRASHALDWTRDLMAAADSPLVPGSDYDGGALIAVDPYGQEAKLSLRKYHVDVHIEDGFARTTIDQTYFNNHPWRLEGTFYFPLPPDASLSRLAMYVDGNLNEGGMAERDYANAVYEEVVRSQRDPALLEWVDGSTFKMRVFPLEGRQEKRIILSYTQRLPTLYGRTSYRFPAGHSLQVVDHWSFHARVKNGGGLAWNSPSHPEMRGKRDGDDLVLDAAADACKVDRDVALDLNDGSDADAIAERVRFSRSDHDGAAYLMLRYRPELVGPAERKRRDWVILFEASADRDPLLARAQVEVVRHLLEHVEHDDTFAVVTAGTRTHVFADAPLPATPANVSAAVAFLERTHLIGSLDLGRALDDAGPLLKAGHNPCLIHIGSGLTAMGRRQEELAKLIPDGVPYFGVGVGKRWGRAWMKQCAEKTGGYFTQINPDEPIAWRAFDLLATLNTPRLLGVQVAAGDGPEQPRFLTDDALVAQGEEVCAVARIDPSPDGALRLPASAVVTGTVDGRPFRKEIPVRDVAPNADYLPRTWAKWEIDRLLAEDASRNKPKVVDLSKAMYVMTPFTSLLVLENEAMYAKYKVDRGRKDHWAMYDCPAKIPVVFEPDLTQPIDVRNAPKTEKPVANVVRPTVVSRATPYILNGDGAVTEVEKEKLLKKLKASLGKEERIFARSGLGENAVTGSDKSREELKKESAPSYAPPPDGTPRREHFGSDLRRPESAESDKKYKSSEFGYHVAVYEGRRAKGLADDPPRRVAGLPPQGEAPWGRSGAPSDRFLTAAGGKPGGGKEFYRDVYFTQTEAVVEGGRLVNEARKKRVMYTLATGRTSEGRSLLYSPPMFTDDARLFSDLIAYAPGLDTSEADVQAVLDAEAAPDLADAPGHIDPAARELIEAARRPHWQVLTVPGEKGEPPLRYVFDGAGRYAYERTLPLGLRERVVCDGATLWHVYPDLGLAARRTVSRFHRADAAARTPWTLPPADDLARGADVERLDDHTVALVPLGAKALRTKDDKPASYWRIELAFDGGRLAERRLVEAPAGTVLRRELYDGKGGVHVLDGDGKELAKESFELADAAAPGLAPDVAGLVVLPMPLRSRAVAFAALGLDGNHTLAEEQNGCYPYLEGEQRVELLAAVLADGRGDEARLVFRDCFAASGDVRPGLFPVLAACGVKVCEEPAFQEYFSRHKDDPLARYFAVLGNRAYDALHGRLLLDLGGAVAPADSFLGRLAEFRDLRTRWTADPSRWVRGLAHRGDAGRMLDFVRRNRDNALGRAMLLFMENNVAPGVARPYAEMADAWAAVADASPAGSYVARYEQARCLLWAGRRDQARKLFQDLYASALKDGVLPPVDLSFREALEGDAGDGWSGLMQRTLFGFIEKKDRPSAVALAWQCRQVGDEPLSDTLLSLALDGLTDDDRLGATLAAVEYLSQTDQLAQADTLVQGLLDREKYAKDAGLWRLGARLADRRGMNARAVAHLEKALNLEYQDLPPVIDLQGWREDYGRLLEYYRTLAVAAADLHQPPPADLAARAVRAADRWRAHDPQSENACNAAARVLRALGERDLAWDYLTTPSGASAGTARTLQREGDLDLTDRAYAVACDHDPDDALLVWERAQNLRQAGTAEEAERLLHRLAEEKWPGKFEPVRERAKWQLGHK